MIILLYYYFCKLSLISDLVTNAYLTIGSWLACFNSIFYGCTWEVAKHERGISVHNIMKDADDLSKLSG